MKKLYTKLLLSLMLLNVASMQLSAQNVERNYVMIEEFTATWCIYCPGAALGIEDLIANDWPVAAIAYHSNDDYSTTEGMARMTYYGVDGIPHTFFDGVLDIVGGNGVNSLYEEFLPLVEQRMAVLTPITLEMENVNFDGTTFSADVLMEAVGTVTSTNTVLHAVLTESQIVQQWQTQYYMMEVQRDMFTSSTGTPVDLVNNTNQTVSIEFTVDPNWEAANCEVVVFVQDHQTKETFNANKAHVLHLEAPTNLTIEINAPDANLQWDALEGVSGYNIYRNWEFLTFTEEANYDDLGLENGNYTYYIRGVYDEGTSPWSNHVAIDAGEFLCVPLYTDGCDISNTPTINNFILNEIENTNSGCGCLDGVGWSQYFDMGPANVEAGETYTLTVSTGQKYYDEYIKVWVDWNDDLQFDESEVMIEGNMAQEDMMYDFDFNVPADATEGLHYLRARTLHHYLPTDACDVLGYGEAEDYLINVGEILLVPASNLTVEVENQDVHLQWDTPDIELLGYNVYRDNELLEFTEESIYHDLDLPNLENYNYYVKALYDDGESVKTSTVTAKVGDFLCTPLYISGCGCIADDGFVDFALNEIENYGSHCGNLNGNAWSQYLDMTAFVDPGETYTLKISCGRLNTYASVWVDWNDNWEFEPNEKVVSDIYMIQGGVLYETDFNVPADAPYGPHFMRGRTQLWNHVDNPYDVYTYGEAEDYVVWVGSGVGTQEISNDNLQIFPNPAKDVVFIQSTTNIEHVQLINLTGQVILNRATSDNKSEINIANIEPGIYFVKVFSSNQIITKKLVIE